MMGRNNKHLVKGMIGYYRNIIKDANIKLYQTVSQYYFFDVQKDSVEKIQKELFEYLQDEEREITNEIKEEIDTLYEQGYLHPNSTQQIKCSIGNYEKAIQNGVSVMVFQVTQMCNLKCNYCPHAQENNTRMRKHANVRMSKEMALKGIDFLALHSDERETIDISFFGGEPLIEFGLIKETVLYAEEKLHRKDITFNISTNALLLSDEKIDFFANHKFCISISMDGPQNIHDKNRKDWNGKGSFHIVYNNFLKLEKAVRNTESRIIISAVLDKQCNLDGAERFFRQLESNKVTIQPALVDDLSSTIQHSMSDEFYWKMTYYKFLIMLFILKRLGERDIPITAGPLKTQLTDLYYMVRNVEYKLSPTLKYQLGDSEQSFLLYLNCQGNFYPVVGVNEEAEDMIIGNINSGIDLDKMEHLLQKASVYKSDCITCPAVAYCQLGITCCVEEKGVTEHIKQEYCENFIKLFHETIGLFLLEKEMKQYYRSSNHVQIIEESKDIKQVIFRTIEAVTLKRVTCTDNHINMPLTSREIGMSALELAYLLFELEKKYDITFDAEDVLDYRFSTIQKIETLILKKRSGFHEY